MSDFLYQKQKGLVFIFFALFFFIEGFRDVPAEAAAVAQQREALQRQRQQALQQQAAAAQQQAYQQQQQLYHQRRQQVLQQREYMQQQAQALQQQMLEQKTASQMEYHQRMMALNQNQAAQQKMFQEIQKQRQGYQQNYQSDLQQNLQQQREMEQQAFNQILKGGPAGVLQTASGSSAYGAMERPSDVVGLADIWSELEINSEVWPLIMDREPKEATIRRAVELYKEQGVVIRKPADYYVDLIDQMSRQNPEMLQHKFMDIMRIVAIIEYDFDNGLNRDMMARKLLGEAAYKKNKQRLGQ